MAIGAATPYSRASLPIPLGTGKKFYPPPGNYLVLTGGATNVEWWDNQTQTWRVLVPISTGDYITCDGVNIRLRNITGAITVASFTAGTGGNTNGIGQAATSVTLAASAAPTHGKTATLFPIIGGSVNTTAVITKAGSGLLEAPLLLCSPPPPGGITATFVCTISAAGVVDAVTNVNAGAGYTAAPTITVIPQVNGYTGSIPPSPATQNIFGGGTLPATNYAWPQFGIPNMGPFTTLPVITANATLTGSGTLTGVGILEAGEAYTGTPTVTVTDAGSATVTLNAVTTAASDTSYLQPVAL